MFCIWMSTSGSSLMLFIYGYKSLLDVKYKSIVMHWVIDLNIGVEHLTYMGNSPKYANW
jgi:hypothetical protein